MLYTNARFATAVEAAVDRLETRTDAEVVVVAAPQSGRYRDLRLLLGLGIAWLMTCVMVWSPWAFSEYWLLIEIPLTAGGFAYLARDIPWLMRRLSSKKRRQRQVHAAATQAFMEEAVHGTRNRTGVLVYLSLLEEQVVVLPDVGIEARVPAGRWNAIQWGPNPKVPQATGDLADFIAGLEAAGRLLAELVPPTDDNPDEISNTPRIRS